jgi:hypothetical protein
MQTKAAPVEAAAPIELPAAAPTTTWPAAYQRPAADRGGAPAAHPSTWAVVRHRAAADPSEASAARPSSPAATARGWWTRVTAAVLAAAALAIGCLPLLRACGCNSVVRRRSSIGQRPPCSACRAQ